MSICKLESCKKEFVPTRKDNVFCSHKCGYKYNHKTEKGKMIREKYKTTKAYKEKRKKSNRKYRENNYLKIRAQRLVRDFPIEECEVPNCSDIGEKHHDDYSKPLEIRYLCNRHHNESLKV